jgi:hypothetical protein
MNRAELKTQKQRLRVSARAAEDGVGGERASGVPGDGDLGGV